MMIGTVTGAVWATRKALCLGGQTLLVVESEGRQIVAADQVGAGTGDRVLVVTGTAAARFSMETPTDAVVAAILDPAGR
jgi:ethanolamine utilization protein EutN